MHTGSIKLSRGMALIAKAAPSEQRCQHCRETSLSLSKMLICALNVDDVMHSTGTNNPAKLAIAREYIIKYNIAIRELVEEFNAMPAVANSNTRFVSQPFAEATDLAQREW